MVELALGGSVTTESTPSSFESSGSGVLVQPLYSNVFRHTEFPLELVRKKALSTRRLNEFISWGEIGKKAI